MYILGSEAHTKTRVESNDIQSRGRAQHCPLKVERSDKNMERGNYMYARCRPQNPRMRSFPRQPIEAQSDGDLSWIVVMLRASLQAERDEEIPESQE